MGHPSVKVNFNIHGHLFPDRKTETDTLPAIKRDLQL